MKNLLSFDQLPEAVTHLISEVSEMKSLCIQHFKGFKEEPKETLLTIQEAAKFLNLSVPTLYSKVSRNELPVMKQGKRLYFSDLELFEYIKKGKKKSNEEIELEALQYLKKKGGKSA